MSYSVIRLNIKWEQYNFGGDGYAAGLLLHDGNGASMEMVMEILQVMKMVILMLQVMDYMGKLGRQEMAREAVSQARG